MQTVSLGLSGLKVSRLCFGTLTMSPLQKGMSPEEGARLLVYAYERGVRFLDTADLYETYPHIRLALRSAPDYVISTKAYCYDRKTAQEALERAFRGTGRDYIDLFMLHEQESLYTLRGHEEALNYLVEQRERGHIGAVGVSTHFIRCVRATARFPQIQVVHPLINLAGIGIQDGSREEMEDAIRAIRARGTGVFAMKPLGGGHLMSDNRAALEYAVHSPLLDAVDAGTLKFVPAADFLSHLSEKEQTYLLLVMERDEVSPSLGQAQRLKQLSGEGKLENNIIDLIMREEKPLERKVTIRNDRLQKYFPASYTPKQMEDVIIKLLEGWHRKRQQEMSR